MKKQFITLGIIALLSLSAFAQQSCGTVKDYDGNTYKTVQLGSQCWMAENLKTTHYADGTLIDFYDNKPKSSILFYVYPNSNPNNKSTLGLMYSWAAAIHLTESNNMLWVDEQGVCPEGWHVPSKKDWDQMLDYVSKQNQFRCGGNTEYIAKSLASQTGWDASDFTCSKCSVGKNPEKNNLTGFNAKPTGGFLFTESKVGEAAYFWTSTESVYYDARAYVKCLSPGSEEVMEESAHMNGCYSVRCLRD